MSNFKRKKSESEYVMENLFGNLMSAIKQAKHILDFMYDEAENNLKRQPYAKAPAAKKKSPAKKKVKA